MKLNKFLLISVVMFLIGFSGRMIWVHINLRTDYENLKEEKEELENMYSILESQQPMIVKEVQMVESIGEFRITHYCGCSKCNGIWGNITKIGTIPQTKHTIAVDPDVISLGSKVIIDGIEYVAEDTGSSIKGNRIDLYVGSHEEAMEKGVIYRNVYKEVK